MSASPIDFPARASLPALRRVLDDLEERGADMSAVRACVVPVFGITPRSADRGDVGHLDERCQDLLKGLNAWRHSGRLHAPAWASTRTVLRERIPALRALANPHSLCRWCTATALALHLRPPVLLCKSAVAHQDAASSFLSAPSLDSLLTLVRRRRELMQNLPTRSLQETYTPSAEHDERVLEAVAACGFFFPELSHRAGFATLASRYVAAPVPPDVVVDSAAADDAFLVFCRAGASGADPAVALVEHAGPLPWVTRLIARWHELHAAHVLPATSQSIVLADVGVLGRDPLVEALQAVVAPTASVPHRVLTSLPSPLAAAWQDASAHSIDVLGDVAFHEAPLVLSLMTSLLADREHEPGVLAEPRNAFLAARSLVEASA